MLICQFNKSQIIKIVSAILPKNNDIECTILNILFYAIHILL